MWSIAFRVRASSRPLGMAPARCPPTPPRLSSRVMPKKGIPAKAAGAEKPAAAPPAPRAGDLRSARPSSLLDTRRLLRRQPGAVGQAAGSVHRPDLHRSAVHSNRNYEVFWGERKEKRAFEDRHASTQAYPGAPGRPRCVQLARVLKKTGSFYYHCDSMRLAGISAVGMSRVA
jgi:hypothetical protein